jgi:formylglycine-generating enzyme required for sulfatase activity
VIKAARENDEAAHFRSWLPELNNQFVMIPDGFLPGPHGPTGPAEERILVGSFESAKYPVTRRLWNDIMGDIPHYVPESLRATWNECPNCPMTYVNWETLVNEATGRSMPGEVQDFLAILNQKTKKLGCTYDLPSDKQLWYMIRGDVTGTNQDFYSAGVTDQNVNDYVTHAENSNGQIQPVGNKRPNAFGIELGNVAKMSKDIFDPANPYLGRSTRDHSWSHTIDGNSADSGFVYAGYLRDFIGISLVRTCH